MITNQAILLPGQAIFNEQSAIQRTFADFHIGSILPFVHCDKPLVLSPATTENRIGEEFEELDDAPAYLTSTTKFSLPIREARRCSLSRENFIPGNKYDVTMTYRRLTCEMIFCYERTHSSAMYLASSRVNPLLAILVCNPSTDL